MFGCCVPEVVIEMVILEQKNCVRSINSKIPEYARDYKKEYLLIIGINKICFNFISKYETDSRKLFVSRYSDRIKYFIKRFLKGQERGKLKDISSLILRKYDFSNIEDLYKNLNYDFEEDEKRSDDNPSYRDFYELFCKFYDKIKIEYFDNDDDDVGYMMPIEYYSVRNDSDDIDGLLSSEDSDNTDGLLSSEDSEDSDTE